MSHTMRPCGRYASPRCATSSRPSDGIAPMRATCSIARLCDSRSVAPSSSAARSCSVYYLPTSSSAYCGTVSSSDGDDPPSEPSDPEPASSASRSDMTSTTSTAILIFARS